MQSSKEQQGAIRKPFSVIIAMKQRKTIEWKDQRSLKKIRDTFKARFHAKRDTIKDRNVMDLTETENIKKRWQEYTELYKKDLNDPDNHDDVITHLEPDILKCYVKWPQEAPLRINLVEMMEFQLSYFKS